MAEYDPLETELYLLLELICSKCNAEFSPASDYGWFIPEATEQDAMEMAKKYLPIALNLGRHADGNGKIHCPACRAR
jgi:hypothetical protein